MLYIIDVDRDLIGVRLTGSLETILDDNQGLTTSINTLFEFVDQPDPLRASICSGQRVIVRYVIDSDFPERARLIYEGHTMDLRDPSDGTVRIGQIMGEKDFPIVSHLRLLALAGRMKEHL